MVGVGGGKTIPSLLLHDAMRATRTVLLVPANLRDKTLKYDVPDLQVHFTLPAIYDYDYINSGKPGVYVLSYNELSDTDSSDLLDIINPDLIVLDEAHNLRNKDAARTRRFMRYIRANRPRLVVMTGSPMTKTILDYAHLIEGALGKNSPVPNDYPSQMEWADAIDNEEAGPGTFGRTEPGALELFCMPGEKIRDGYRRRLIESHGVASTKQASCAASLEITEIRVTPPKAVQDALAHLGKLWAWDGEDYDKAIEIYRVERQLAQGFFYRAVWPGGVKDTDWLEAKNAWARCINQRLSHSNRSGQDSPALLEAMAERGDWVTQEYLNWVAQRHKPEPARETVEISRWVVDYCHAWKRAGVGLIWVDSPTVGQWLAESGIPYYGDNTNQEVIDISRGPSAGNITIALSAQSHGTGKNLQKWKRNLILYPQANGAAWEQTIGRTHRDGQLAPVVTVDLLLSSVGAERAWETARVDARRIEQSMGMDQLLTHATLIEGKRYVAS